MAIIDKDFVKEVFPEWEKFCTFTGGVLTADQRLDNSITLAEDQFSQYLSDVTEETLTGVQRLHLLNLVRKFCFDQRHGDTKFETKPQIIVDYEMSIKWLDAASQAQGAINRENIVSVTAKERKFNQWFTDETEGTQLINSNDE